MNTFSALIKREILDGQNGMIKAPLIFAVFAIGIVLITAIAFGPRLEFDDVFVNGEHVTLGDQISKALETEKGQQDISAAVTITYWASASLPWIVLPFVIFFGLLATLYEERRDRSILFWKSMPVADWQEVLAKFVTLVFIAPVITFVIVVATQIVIALILSVFVLFQGGPVMEMWPLGLMISSWASFFPDYLLWALWASPLLAWLLFVSSYANRMPLLWAIVPIAAIGAVEGIVMKTTNFLEWIGWHLARGVVEAQYGHLMHGDVDIDGPRDVYDVVLGASSFDMYAFSFGTPQFWLGLVIAGAFIYGAIEMRKRAI